MKLLAGLGMVMIDDLSVEGNVYLYGAIYGLDRAKIREKFATSLSGLNWRSSFTGG